MNIFSKITRQMLLQNRTRTVVTIIGIILSAAMFTAVTTFVSSVQNHLLNLSVKREGDWYGRVRAAQVETLDAIASDPRVIRIAQAQVIGYTPLSEVRQAEKPYLYVLGADDAFMETMPVHVLSGRLPLNGNELLIPQHLAKRGGIEYAIGDVLQFPMSLRTVDGKAVFQGTEYSQTEALVFQQDKTYTVVGFCEAPNFEQSSAAGYTAFTHYDECENAVYTDCYFKTSDPRDAQPLLNGLNVEGAATNRDVLMYMGISGYVSFMAVFAGFAAILIGLIMFGSVSLIYNAFSISVSERTKQFGLLISIGATKKQIRRCVYSEAVLLSVIGIPLGVASGVLGIGVTLYFLSGTELLADMHVHASIPALVLAAIIAFLTVLISARIPARRAMRVSAIDAIRQTADVHMSVKREPSYRLVAKLFGLPGVLAMKHFRRNRRRYRATVVSLFMSIVLFIGASSFSFYLTESVTGVFELSDADVWVSYAQKTGEDASVEEVLDLIGNDPNLENAMCLHSTTYGVLAVPSENAHPEFKALFPPAVASSGAENCSVTGGIYVIDDDAFCAFLAEQGFDDSLFFEKDCPRAVISGRINQIDQQNQRFINAGTLQTLPEKMEISLFDETEFGAAYPDVSELSEEELRAAEDAYSYSADIIAGAISDELPFGLNGRTGTQGVILAIYPRSNMPQIRTDLTSASYYLKTSDHAATTERLLEVLNVGSPDINVYDYVADAENERSVVLVMNVFAYGFITLISLIAVANVFNTISTNIRLRRREFAMLKSVGMTRSGFRKMMNLECLLYGCKSLFYGLPVSILLTWLIYRAASNGYASTFHMPPLPIVIAVCSVFLVVFVTMLYSMRKIERENPIDALKCENL